MTEPRMASPKGSWNHMAKLAQIAKTRVNRMKTNLPAMRTGADFRREDICIPYSSVAAAGNYSVCGNRGDTDMICIVMSWG